MSLEKKDYLTPKSHSWARKLPMSAAVRAGDLLFISGQVSADAGLKPGNIGKCHAGFSLDEDGSLAAVLPSSDKSLKKQPLCQKVNRFSIAN